MIGSSVATLAMSTSGYPATSKLQGLCLSDFRKYERQTGLMCVGERQAAFDNPDFALTLYVYVGSIPYPLLYFKPRRLTPAGLFVGYGYPVGIFFKIIIAFNQNTD